MKLLLITISRTYHVLHHFGCHMNSIIHIHYARSRLPPIHGSLIALNWSPNYSTFAFDGTSDTVFSFLTLKYNSRSLMSDSNASTAILRITMSSLSVFQRASDRDVCGQISSSFTCIIIVLVTDKQKLYWPVRNALYSLKRHGKLKYITLHRVNQ